MCSVNLRFSARRVSTPRIESRIFSANEIITRLDIVGHTIDDAVKRAENDVYRNRQENSRAELPEVKVPSFLQKVEAVLKRNTVTQAGA
jgi:hypothetical protein